MTTALSVIKQALILYGIIDEEEEPTAADVEKSVLLLNNLLRDAHMDAAAQYLMRRTETMIPRGRNGHTYTFVIGTAKPEYLVQKDAVGVRMMWAGDVGVNIRRELRIAPIVDIMRTTNLGIPTKWHQERQIDGSILISLWQPPAQPTRIFIDYGARVNPITAPDGSDEVDLPPEGIHDVVYLLGRRLATSYGRNAQSIAIALADSEAVKARWDSWSRGQQWLRFLRG